MENNDETIQECINILKNNKIDTNTKPGRDDIIKLKDAIMASSDNLKMAVQKNIEENFYTNYLKNNININTASAVSNGLSLVSTPSIIASLVLDSPHLCFIGGIGLLTSLCMDSGTDLYKSLHEKNTNRTLLSVQQWIKTNNEISIKDQSNQSAQNDNNRTTRNDGTINEAIKHLQQIMQIKYYNNYYQKTIANNLVEDLFKIIDSQLEKRIVKS
ncbi:MAG: hypothetical protein IJT15_01650 [Rickettsiales bacterium]|nr:hypothetical protein [Rickettsiales bacterium]